MENKYINHISWLINALKEHNKIINQYLKYKMNEKIFISNKNFQQYYYLFNIYLKLFSNIDKGYNIILSNNKINKASLITLKNTYLNRCANNFKNAGIYLKKSKQELSMNLESFSLLFHEMKNIASLLMYLESDINFLILNLY